MFVFHYAVLWILVKKLSNFIFDFFVNIFYFTVEQEKDGVYVCLHCFHEDYQGRN